MVVSRSRKLLAGWCRGLLWCGVGGALRGGGRWFWRALIARIDPWFWSVDRFDFGSGALISMLFNLPLNLRGAVKL